MKLRIDFFMILLVVNSVHASVRGRRREWTRQGKKQELGVSPTETINISLTLNPNEAETGSLSANTPVVPAVVDFCLLQDESGSFRNDIQHLQSGTTAEDFYNLIVAQSPSANFAVAGFLAHDNCHSGETWAYRLLSSMSPNKTDWLNGINQLEASGGGWESQYDAIVAGAGPGIYNDDLLGPQESCGWRDRASTPGVHRVMAVATDEVFTVPGDNTCAVNDFDSTVTALQNQGISIIGLKAYGASNELDDLANVTDGSVQPLASDARNIAASTLAGLQGALSNIYWELQSCDHGLSVRLDPEEFENVNGGNTVTFNQTIRVENNVSLCGSTLSALVEIKTRSSGQNGGVLQREFITVKVPPINPPIPVIIDINPTCKTGIMATCGQLGRGQLGRGQRCWPRSAHFCSANTIIEVAILNTTSFEATLDNIDSSTLTFGKNGNEASALPEPSGFDEHDVNCDGRDDLVVRFNFGDTGFSCDDITKRSGYVKKTGVLLGQTKDGDFFSGDDKFVLSTDECVCCKGSETQVTGTKSCRKTENTTLCHGFCMPEKRSCVSDVVEIQ